MTLRLTEGPATMERQNNAMPRGWTSLDERRAWKKVLQRDAAGDTDFFYGVTTTGIYCRPSCPSRRPKRDNVRFFSSAEVAERAGFRACQRCRPQHAPRSSTEPVDRAREYLDKHLSDLGDHRLTLQLLAQEVGLSPHHLQRRFKACVGVTPAEYVRARRNDRLKQELKNGETVSRATYGAGFGSSSRVYERATAQLGMTPATYKRGGLGARIEYVIQPTPLGAILVAATDRGISAVMMGDDHAEMESALNAEYPAATITRATRVSSNLHQWVALIVSGLSDGRQQHRIPIDVQASAFRWKVWHELQKIPIGETRTYSEIAKAIGAPAAARAVANACAKNPVSLVVPCHRVVRRSGALGGYRWGLDRKRALLDMERSATEGEPLANTRRVRTS
jgi:AraC family transcriptional regulator, regulatory protein of adaptative response / methylated-DNA-[protein]-cysteine methyltransferase